MGCKARPCAASAVRVLQGPVDRHSEADLYAVQAVLVCGGALRRYCAGINRLGGR